MNQDLAFYGTGENENLIFVGLNLTYHYAITGDPGVGELLSHALDLNTNELPKRELVPLKISYGKNQITITSKHNHVNTTIATQDIFASEQKIYQRNHLVYVNKGKTVITMDYPYFKEGCLISIVASLLTGGFLYYTKKKGRTETK